MNKLRGNKYSVLIPDGEDDRTLIVVRSLIESKNVRIYVVSSQRSTSQYSRHCHFFRLNGGQDNNDTRLRKVIEIARNYSIEFILPIGERGFQFTIAFQKQLENHFKVPPIPFRKSLNIVRDKWLFNEFCLQNKFPAIKSEKIQNTKEFFDILSNFSYPVLLKPRVGEGGIGIQYISSESKLRELLKAKINFYVKKGFILQEYIKGSEVDLSVLCKKGQILAYTVQKPIHKLGNTFSFGKKIEIIHDDAVLKIGEKILKDLQWNGVAHIDFIKSDNNGLLYALDFNPRFWGTLLGSTVSGVNFPYMTILASLNKPQVIPDYKEMIFAILTRKEIFNWIRGKDYYKTIPFKNTHLRFVLKDPFPAIL